jgi:hypothetical protein
MPRARSRFTILGRVNCSVGGAHNAGAGFGRVLAHGFVTPGADAGVSGRRAPARPGRSVRRPLPADRLRDFHWALGCCRPGGSVKRTQHLGTVGSARSTNMRIIVLDVRSIPRRPPPLAGDECCAAVPASSAPRRHANRLLDIWQFDSAQQTSVSKADIVTRSADNPLGSYPGRQSRARRSQRKILLPDTPDWSCHSTSFTGSYSQRSSARPGFRKLEQSSKEKDCVHDSRHYYVLQRTVVCDQ